MARDHKLPVYAHALEVKRLANQTGLSEDEIKPLRQGTTLPIAGGGSLEVLHTPGHSGGSVCLCVRPADSKRMHSVVVGDTLFPGSCGRLDLPDSDVSAMFDSLATLRALDDKLTVYPGHGYSGPSTSIAQEKASGLLREFSKEQWMRMHG